jgi:hypothetical protein
MKLQPITPEQFSNLRWLRYTNYNFASKDAVAPILVHELTKALIHLPLCFVSTGNSFSLVAIQGLQPGKNLCVAPDGSWLAGYIPATYRSYPFAVANTPDGESLLCFDEDSNLLADTGGELFYEDNGELAQGIKNVISFFAEVAQSRNLTEQICAVLQKYELIQPWRVNIQYQTGEQAIDGLYKVDEATFNDLSAEAFDELRKLGAVAIIYCQLLSMQNLQRLADLAQVHIEVSNNNPNLDFLKADSGNLDLSILDK